MYITEFQDRLEHARGNASTLDVLPRTPVYAEDIFDDYDGWDASYDPREELLGAASKKDTAKL